MCFQLTHFLCDNWENIYILCLIIIIKLEVWTSTHCLGLGLETLVCAVCLSIFLYAIDVVFTSCLYHNFLHFSHFHRVSLFWFIEHYHHEMEQTCGVRMTGNTVECQLHCHSQVESYFINEWLDGLSAQWRPFFRTYHLFKSRFGSESYLFNVKDQRYPTSNTYFGANTHI